MPVFTVRVRNLSSLQAKVKKLNWGIQAGVVSGLRGVAEPMKLDIQSELSRPKSGPIVHRSNPTRQVKVSIPGEPPAEDLGMLVNSIDVQVDPVQFNLEISAAAPYARYLEEGTRHMLPRPFLRPALARWRERIINAIHSAIRKAL